MRRDIQKHIEIERKKTIQWLMPDTCQITPSMGEDPQVTEMGIVIHQSPAPHTWRTPQGIDTFDIPCRMTIERAFVPDKLQMQVTVVSRYVLEVPFEMREKVKASDRVVKGGRKYEIRKLSDQSEWDVTLEMTIVEISTEYDHD